MDLEPALDRWMGDGPSAPPEGLLEGAMSRIAGTPQRSRSRWPLPASAATSHLALAAVLLVSAIATLGLLGPGGRDSLGGLLRLFEGASPTGLHGSLWLHPTDASTTDTYLEVHPDGTVVSFQGYAPIGLGVWRPTGERSFRSVVERATTVDAQPGTSRVVADWALDATATTATITLAETVTLTDGTGLTGESDTWTVRRLSMPRMPTDAAASTPPDPGWWPELGPPAFDRSLAGVGIEPYRPANYDVTHADGTSFGANGYCGDTMGLWAPAGETAAIGASWFPVDTGPYRPLVWSSRADPDTGLGSSVYGYADRFTDTTPVIQPMRLATYRDRPLPSPDPASWPSQGMVWTWDTGDGRPARQAWFADGTVISVHPTFGRGVGLWQPVGPDTFASTVDYRYGDVQLRSEATRGADGDTLAIAWEQEDMRSG